MENTKSLRERVIAGLEERRERILNGDINCIPLPFKRFQSELPGVEQETYYLVSGGTKSAEMRQNCSTEIDILNREIEHLDKLAHGEH